MPQEITKDQACQYHGVYGIVKLRQFGLATLSLTIAASACSSTAKKPELETPVVELVHKESSKQLDEPSPPEAEEERYAQFRLEIDRFRESLREELREVIREEILPELWTSSGFSTEVANTQQKARANSKAKTFLGRVEWIKFQNPNFELQARIDTGAQTSSMHAENIREQKINGELFVQYETTDQDGKRHTLVRRVVTRTPIRNNAGQLERRYVIRERIRLGRHSHEININLNDRSDLRYQFLIGRNLLMGNYIVDVSKSHLLGDRL